MSGGHFLPNGHASGRTPRDVRARLLGSVYTGVERSRIRVTGSAGLCWWGRMGSERISLGGVRGRGRRYTGHRGRP